MFDENSIISINGKMLQSKMLYDESRDLLSKIDSLLDEYLDHIIPASLPEHNYNIIASTALRMNRLDPHMYDSYSNYLLAEIVRHGSVPLGEIATPWVVPRFKRNYKFGYPLITATRFGKDIPELDPEALKSIPIPNIPNELQIRIGTMFRKSRDLQEEANRLENAAILEFERLYENSVESN